MKRLLFIFSVLVGLISCEEETEVHFEEPMGKKDLASFDTDVIGNYIGVLDSSIIEVGDSWIVHTGKTYYKYSKLALDSAKYIVYDDNLIIDTIENVSYYYKSVGDSIIIEDKWLDTIFKISKNQLLKKDNKRFYLNYNEGSDWIVRTLEVDAEKLKIGKLKVDSLETVNQYTDIAGDTLEDGGVDHYIISPTKKEFKKLMKSDVFEYNQEYLKINNGS